MGYEQSESKRSLSHMLISKWHQTTSFKDSHHGAVCEDCGVKHSLFLSDFSEERKTPIKLPHNIRGWGMAAINEPRDLFTLPTPRIEDLEHDGLSVMHRYK